MPALSTSMFATIARYTDPIEAHIACGRLRAEGIDAHVADDQIAVANWEWRLAVGGTRVRVPEAQATRARDVLHELDAGGYALDADPAGTLETPERESPSSRIAWVALMVFGIPLPWRRRRDDDARRGM